MAPVTAGNGASLEKFLKSLKTQSLEAAIASLVMLVSSILGI